jgi:uncharacterized protein
MNTTAVSWFEIPTTNFERAVRFYEGLLQITLTHDEMQGVKNAFFPYTQGQGIGGALTDAPYAKPHTDGGIIYLAVPTMVAFDRALSKLADLGGQLVMPKTAIGPNGHFALITDSEGNRVGLHVGA